MNQTDNRIIKFRMWDLISKKMYQDIQMVAPHENEVLMQFTGLYDKQGKEIYEGDIVKFEDWSPKEIVYQDKSFAGFTLKNTDLFLTDYDAINMEVIGNIYENPELLKQL